MNILAVFVPCCKFPFCFSCLMDLRDEYYIQKNIFQIEKQITNNIKKKASVTTDFPPFRCPSCDEVWGKTGKFNFHLNDLKVNEMLKTLVLVISVLFLFNSLFKSSKKKLFY